LYFRRCVHDKILNADADAALSIPETVKYTDF